MGKTTAADRKARKQRRQAKSERARDRRTREALRAQYDASRREDEHEPSWTHPFFLPGFDPTMCLDEDHHGHVRFVRRGEVRFTDFMGLPRILDRNGFKVGTPTWIFMRRSEPETIVETHEGWTILGSAYDGVTYWVAYDDEHPIGVSTLTSKCVGPALTLAEIKVGIDSGVTTAEARLARTRADANGRRVIIVTGTGDLPPLGEAIDVRDLGEEDALAAFRRFVAS